MPRNDGRSTRWQSFQRHGEPNPPSVSLQIRESEVKIRATRLVRRMRGRSGAHLVKVSDGHYYVVKPFNNPQGPRILANEFFASTVYSLLAISAGEPALIEVTDRVIEEWQEIDTDPNVLPLPGVHFGSRYPACPHSLTVYDYLPASFLQRLSNSDSFVGALVADVWMGKCDPRQAVFYRGPNGGFECRMIDHKGVFGGAAWDFRAVPVSVLHPFREVYASCSSAHVEAWTERIRDLPNDVLYMVGAAVPREWLGSEASEFWHLIDHLVGRKRILPRIVKNVVGVLRQQTANR